MPPKHESMDTTSDNDDKFIVIDLGQDPSAKIKNYLPHFLATSYQKFNGEEAMISCLGYYHTAFKNEQYKIEKDRQYLLQQQQQQQKEMGDKFAEKVYFVTRYTCGQDGGSFKILPHQSKIINVQKDAVQDEFVLYCKSPEISIDRGYLDSHTDRSSSLAAPTTTAGALSDDDDGSCCISRIADNRPEHSPSCMNCTAQIEVNSDISSWYAFVRNTRYLLDHITIFLNHQGPNTSLPDGGVLANFQSFCNVFSGLHLRLKRRALIKDYVTVESSSSSGANQQNADLTTVPNILDFEKLLALGQIVATTDLRNASEFEKDIHTYSCLFSKARPDELIVKLRLEKTVTTYSKDTEKYGEPSSSASAANAAMPSCSRAIETREVKFKFIDTEQPDVWGKFLSSRFTYQSYVFDYKQRKNIAQGHLDEYLGK
ncbi:hypothetical protein H4219_003635 [Mycoemilia scoparia]|uniref:Uncharacterized protein n=1 Tax=Mycoemilia scoparia TaxID=417184 RepID=A0A9W8DT24_9FUNG|nr:hypothetical protein H4219_003635 [Mycoemilia scoparia]